MANVAAVVPAEAPAPVAAAVAGCLAASDPALPAAAAAVRH